MGFWGSLGKGLLKIAPIAAAFIPGVGPLASMAIGAGTSALSKKLEGGSGKDVLMAGATGGLSGYGAGKAAKGLGPSASVSDKFRSGIGQAMGGGSRGGYPGFAGGSFGGDTSRDIPGGMGGGIFGSGQNQGGDFDSMLGGIHDILARYGNSGSGGRTQSGRGVGPSSDTMYGGRMGRLIGPAMNQRNQSAPNLAESIGQGRAEAIQQRGMTRPMAPRVQMMQQQDWSTRRRPMQQEY